jgi:hypothetical protein
VSIHPGSQALQVENQFGGQRFAFSAQDSKVVWVKKNPVAVGQNKLPIVADDLSVFHGASQAAGYFAGMQARTKEALKGAFYQLFG